MFKDRATFRAIICNGTHWDINSSMTTFCAATLPTLPTECIAACSCNSASYTASALTPCSLEFWHFDKRVPCSQRFHTLHRKSKYLSCISHAFFTDIHTCKTRKSTRFRVWNETEVCDVCMRKSNQCFKCTSLYQRRLCLFLSFSHHFYNTASFFCFRQLENYSQYMQMPLYPTLDLLLEVDIEYTWSHWP